VCFGGHSQMVVKMVVRPIAKLSEELDQLQAVHRHGCKSTRILITLIIGLFGDRAQPGDDRWPCRPPATPRCQS
jgi:hypothetical protein